MSSNRERKGSEAVCDLKKLLGEADERIVDVCADTGGETKVGLAVVGPEVSWC